MKVKRYRAINTMVDLWKEGDIYTEYAISPGIIYSESYDDIASGNGISLIAFSPISKYFDRLPDIDLEDTLEYKIIYPKMLRELIELGEKKARLIHNIESVENDLKRKIAIYEDQ